MPRPQQRLRRIATSFAVPLLDLLPVFRAVSEQDKAGRPLFLDHCHLTPHGRLPPAERERRRLDLVLLQASSYIPLGAFQEIVYLLLRHQADVERLDDPGLGGQFHFLIGRSYLFLGDDERASHHAARGLAEATRAGDDATAGKIHYVLAQQGAISGGIAAGLEHGRQALVLLERASEQWWLGPAYWAVGLNQALRGEFAAALEAEARATVRGDAVGDPQLQSSAAWATGIIHAALGDAEAGIAAGRRAVECSPDPLDTALAQGWLGYAYLEAGDPAQAIPRLELSIQHLGQFRVPQPQSWFTVFLAEGHRMTRELERALDLATQGFRLAQAANTRQGAGWAQRALGRIAQARGTLGDVAAHLGEALATFEEMGARYEVARTHCDLAAVAEARGQPDQVAAHLDEARRLFRELDLARPAERVAALATQLGAAG